MANVPPIIFDEIADDVIARAKSQALEYALISKPFTFNRMQKPMSECVVNIAKGKFVEYLFVSLCRERGLLVDTDSCETPFWERDHRDFVLMDREWDIKSIFLHNTPPNNAFNDCPALIPNRFRSDQWGTRDHRYVPSVSKMPAYVFVFLSHIELRIELDVNQVTFIQGLCHDHKEQVVDQEPFEREWFIERFPSSGNCLMINPKDQFLLEDTRFITLQSTTSRVGQVTYHLLANLLVGSRVKGSFYEIA